MNNTNAVLYERGRNALLECLQIARGIEKVDVAACDRLQAKLYEESFNLVAVGQFKRGKSSVINALLGQPLLPVGVIPLTSVITVIRYGPEAALDIVFESGEVKSVPLEELADYVTEKGNPKNNKHVGEACIYYPSSWLQYGLRLVDTPGIGSFYDHNNDMTLRYLPHADAVLFVGSVDQPMSRAELEFLGAIRPYAAKLFCLMNKTDYLSPEELAESLRFSSQAIHAALGLSVPLYAVSAREALKQKRAAGQHDIAGVGFGEFEAALRHFVAEDKTQAWFLSVSNGLTRILSQVRLLDELELGTLAAPVEKVKENLAFFEQNKQQILQKQWDYEVLLKADLQRVVAERVQTSLERFKVDERERISPLITQWAAELRELSSPRLTHALEQRLFAEVRRAYDEWIDAQEPAIAKAFAMLCERFSSNIQATIDELSSCSAALFNIAFNATGGESTWVRQSEFTYRFWREPVGLQILTGGFVCALPRFLGRTLIVARMRKLAADLVEVHAGRIRHEWEQRLYRSSKVFRAQLLEQMQAVIAAIEGALEQGLSIRHRGEVEAWRRRSELARELKEIGLLEARAKAVVEDHA